VRDFLGIPKNAFVVGGSGAETWRKGKDLFIQLALAVSRKYDEFPVHFVWIGGRNHGKASYELQHDIEHAGLSNRIHFVAEVPNPTEYFRTFDVFAMVSREDPYPLVNLEVAAMGKPVVCFDNAGGTPEFVENDAGFVVPYLNVDTMAEKVVALLTNKDLREKLGRKAAKKVRERHDISIAAPKILKIINRFLGPGHPRNRHA
jgi:glycosyltransferase involved in cell wall biosynthesis